MEIVCVPAIVTITYLIVEAYKKWLAKGRKKWLAVIPLIAMVIGGLLGVAMFYVAPQLIIAQNVWWALVVGLCSGLSATGTNQIFKQLKKMGVEVKEVEQPKDDESEKKK